ncbi:hypothetical protein ccbrp13_29950 [Ktedonobacteria bacterium brp13]|nr:hypothetical protein ccbrp13_29950 [Ktedonobacteria bacterium brp13]
MKIISKVPIWNNTTSVNYLRTCMKWGALPGLEQESMLSEGELKYLTADLLPF